MAGNRVDDLEETVRQLEATINGLTDELMETKERMRALEDEVESPPDIVQSGAASGGAGNAGGAGGAGGSRGSPTPDDGTDASGTGTGNASTDPDAEAPADGDKGGADDGEDNADSGSSDDIIVA